MLVDYVLLACLNVMHPTCIAPVFYKKEVCEQAGKAWIGMNPGNVARYRCVPKAHIE